MIGKEHSLSLFYLYLKLNSWQSGSVSGWGLVEKVQVYEDMTTDKAGLVSKPLHDYLQSPIAPLISPLIKKPLSPGLDLLDFYLTETNKRSNTFVYIVVISVFCTMAQHCETVFLKITNPFNPIEFRRIIYDKYARYPKRSKKPSSLYRVNFPRLDTGPLNSYRRKY